MAKQLLKFGIHDFLNASPLLVPLTEHSAEKGFQVVKDSPAALADKLKAGDLDLAMIPSVEYFKLADNYRLVPYICIASRGEVGTVLLLAKKPLREISSIAVDFRSRTSVAVLKVLFPFNTNLKMHLAPPDLELMLTDHSAALIIGDGALTLGHLDPEIRKYDLSEEWFRQTGKTFVHAVVAVPHKVILDNNQKQFIQESKLIGFKHIDEIVRAHKGAFGVDSNVLEDYLKNKIKYDLNEDAIDGLNHFRDLCYEHGIISKKTAAKFI